MRMKFLGRRLRQWARSEWYECYCSIHGSCCCKLCNSKVEIQADVLATCIKYSTVMRNTSIGSPSQQNLL